MTIPPLRLAYLAVERILIDARRAKDPAVDVLEELAHFAWDSVPAEDRDILNARLGDIDKRNPIVIYARMTS